MKENGDATPNRFLVKLSGEYLAGEGGAGFSAGRLTAVSRELKRAQRSANGVAVVVGGGNFFRGGRNLPTSIDRVTGDQIGMLATAMNALALRDAFREAGMEAESACAFPIGGVLDQYHPDSARAWLDQGVVVILAGGTGNPFFTTDTTACLRALELGAHTVVKATRVNGVFSDDPEQCPDAVRYDHISYDFALSNQLQVMDATAFTLCRANRLSVRVIDLGVDGNLERAIKGESVGTLVDVLGGDYDR